MIIQLYGVVGTTSTWAGAMDAVTQRKSYHTALE